MLPPSSRPSALLLLLLLLLGCCTLPLSAFLFGPTASRSNSCRCHLASAATASSDDPDEDGGKGFMLRWNPPLPPTNEDEGEAVRKEWEIQYKAYIKKNGAHLCALAWRGYETYGRGAIVAKLREEEDEDPAPAGIGKFEGVPSAMYVPLARWAESLETAQSIDGDIGLQSGAMRRILERVLGYDPQEDFCIVFETAKLCGADIVRPSITPPIMAERLMPEGGEGGAINVESRKVDE